eukprot:scaffold15486_cov111-Isochrysis_galbana.AAC.10
MQACVSSGAGGDGRTRPGRHLRAQAPKPNHRPVIHSILEEEEGGEQSEGDQGPGDRGGAEEPAEGGGRPEGQEDHQEEPLDRVGRHCVGRVGAVLQGSVGGEGAKGERRSRGWEAAS